MNSPRPPVGIDDAVNEVAGTRLPMLHSEVKEIMQDLWDTAFREGAYQGRRAGIEAVQNKLRLIANAGRTDPQTRSLLLDIADSYDDPRSEYQDPTQAIRELLAGKARQRDGR